MPPILPSQRVPETPTVPDLLRRGLQADPDACALISASVRWSWRDLDEQSNRLAAGLLGLGLRPGDRVASLMPNGPDLVIHYLACFKTGLVATPLNYRYTAPEMDHALAVSQARAFLVHAERIPEPAATAGYWENPAATQELFRDGWLDSGDVMRADDDGYYYFRGRRKQIIVHDGSNISPQEIEEVLLAYPGVASAGVIGIHDIVHGENVRAYITVAEGTDRPTSQDLIRFARSKVGYKAPDEIVFLDEMPHTDSGKVNRTELKRMAEENIHRATDD